MRLSGILIASVLSIGLVGVSCKKVQKSRTTGVHYNDKDWGGFESKPIPPEQETGPNLVYIPGGTFVGGLVESDIAYEGDAIPKRFHVSDFYMDKTEVANEDYLEYLFWLKKVYTNFPQVEQEAKPDTLVWRSKLGYNEPFVKYYFRHPSYKEYPVVGVTWVQADNYCRWRSDRVNETVLIEKGIIKANAEQTQNEENFNKDAYLVGQYEPVEGSSPVKDASTGQNRKVKEEDGILLPDYRLPFEMEWEYAAVAAAGKSNAKFENVNDRRTYPWDGVGVRHTEGRHTGKMQANFKRGKGDYSGIAELPNDGATITAPVVSYWPNDFGLYNMAGNVSEWCMDVYRPLSLEDLDELNPFRGNEFVKPEKDEDGNVAPKDSLGRITYIPVTPEENAARRNYKVSDNKGAKDEMEYDGNVVYDFGNNSLISNKARVYKGSSWNDRTFYNSPGVRRFLDENQGMSTLGFRCAMLRVGGRKWDADEEK